MTGGNPYFIYTILICCISMPSCHHQHGPKLYGWASPATTSSNMDQNCTKGITCHRRHQHGPKLHEGYHLPPQHQHRPELHEGCRLGPAPRYRGPDDRWQPIFYLYNLNMLYLNALITQCLVATTITNMDQDCTKSITCHRRQQHEPRLHGWVSPATTSSNMDQNCTKGAGSGTE